MPHDRSEVASATPGQQLLSVSEFIVPGDEPTDSSVLDEPGHGAFVSGSSAWPLYSPAEPREHGLLRVASKTESSLGESAFLNQSSELWLFFYI